MFTLLLLESLGAEAARYAAIFHEELVCVDGLYLDKFTISDG